MASSLVYTVVLSRNNKQRLTPKIVRQQVEYIANRALAGARGKHWESIIVDKIPASILAKIMGTQVHTFPDNSPAHKILKEIFPERYDKPVDTTNIKF